MKKSTLIKLAALLGLFAGAAAHSQVFNMQDIQQGYHNYGYNMLYYGQGAFTDAGNNIWNGFDDGNGPGSTASFGGGFGNDPLDPNNPGNPYANCTAGYWAPNEGHPSGTIVPFAPTNPGNTGAGNAYSDGTVSPITVPQIMRGFDTGSALTAPSDRTNAAWIFSIAAGVNTGNPAWGANVPPFSPLGLCVLSNVPAGTYSLYLYGANFDGTRGASFVVSNTGTPLNGLYQTTNPNAAAGSGPLTSYGLGVDYVVYNNVAPDAAGRITITWGGVSNINSGLTGEGDFNGLQLIASSANPAAPVAIVQQPFDSTFGAGSTATLFADGRGNPAPAFQWYGPSGAVSGQTSNTLTLANFLGSEGGNYYCVVSNTSGAVTSSVASLNVATTLSILAQNPTNDVTVAAGSVLNETLSLAAIGAEPITYYWESNGVVIDIANGTSSAETNGSTIDFGTSSSVTVSNITSSCTLSCIVSNALGTVTNTPISVTIAPTPSYSYASAVLALNPVGYWPLNETNGTTAVNFGSFGPAANGVYSDVPACPLQQGVPGPSVLGMGSNNFGTQFSINNAQDNNDTKTGVVINDAALDTASDHDVTVAMWVLQPASSSYGIQEVYGQADSTLIRFTVFGTDNAQMDFVDGGNDIIGGPLLNDGNWHFWTGTFTASDNHVVTYLDGQQIASGTEGAPGTSTDSTVIGGSPDDTGRNFIGSVCQVAVIPSALTAAQVATLFDAAGVAPGFTIKPPPNVVANAGASATLGPVDAVGSEPLMYYWYAGTPGSGTLLTNGNRISGATSTNVVINPVAGSDQNDYYVIASNAFAMATSSVVTLTVATTNNARVFAGQNPTFSVSTGDASYQWSTNGTAVTGATNHTFTLANVQTANNGETISCAISDPSYTGTVNGTVETLTIVPTPSDSYAQTVLNDHPIAYYRLNEANVYGDNGNGDDGLPAYDYISGNNGTYTNVVLNTNVTSDPYGVQLTDADGDATFGTFDNMDSFAGFIPIDFSLAPSNSPAQPGNATFSVECWIFGNAGQHNGAFVTKGYGLGSQNPSPGFFEQFSLQNSDLGTTGSRIEFDVTDALGNESTAGSAASTINASWHHVVGVCDQPDGKVLLYVDGLPITPNFGTGTITPGNGIMSTPVPTSIGAKQSVENSGTYDGQWVGDIDEVSIYNYALTPSQVTAHYIAAGIAPVIVTPPLVNITANAGTTTNFTVVALGTLPLGYQWSGPGGVIAGATNATLTLVDVNFSGTPPNTGQGTYTVTITNLYGTNTASGNLNVSGGAPQIVQDLLPDTFAIVGGTAVFPVVVQGSAPLTNAWQDNGTPLVNGGRISGADTSTLTISNVQASDAGNYQLFVTNSSGPNSSSVSTLIVETEPLFNGSGGDWTANAGTGVPAGVPSVTGDVLTITTDVGSENTSFFFDNPMYIGAFQVKFTYQDVTNGQLAADGFTFCLQNDPKGMNAFGGGGSSLGYSGVGSAGIADSAAIGIELFPQVGSVGWQYLTNGETPTSFIPPTQITLGSGDPIDWTILYNGSSITLTMSDEVTHKTYTTNFTVGSLPAIVGGDTAYIGFTGATGGYEALQTISNFTYVPFPMLSATTSNGSVEVTWPTAIGGYALQQSSSLSSTNWTAIAGPYTTNASGLYQYNVSAPTGNQFYRLVVP